jgi:hypothetical protein
VILASTIERLTPLAGLIEARCEASINNRFGRISSGYAIIEGLTMNMILGAPKETPKSFFKVQLRTLNNASIPFPYVIDESTLNFLSSVEDGDVMVLCLATVDAEDWREGLDAHWWFLVLRLKYSSRDEYERLGLWEPDFWHESGHFSGKEWLAKAEMRTIRMV